VPHKPNRADSASAIIVALDGFEEVEALRLARMLAGRGWGFKINDLLLRAGSDAIPRLKSYGSVFCDVKLHDIPNTVAHQVRLLEAAGADLITLHCGGGAAMLAAARRARRSGAKLLGVTVLTALSEETTQQIYGKPTNVQVKDFARLALQEGLDGVICPPTDLGVVAEADPERRLLRVTPGIRPAWYRESDDQVRVLSPHEARAAGADLLVIGRPISEAEEPVAACERIVKELELSEG
jgi:orotidine-5'-phosphate decarboxylase